MWADDLNKKGGLLGRQVKIVSYDDRSDPTTSGKLYEKLLSEDKVDLLLGPYGTGPSIPASNIAESYHKPIIITSGTGAEIYTRGLKYLFGLLVPIERAAQGVVDLAKQKGLKTIAVMYEDTPFTRAVAKGLRQWAPGAGLQIVYDQEFPAKIGDLSSLLLKAKAQNPDVMAGGVYFPNSVLMTRQMKELGFDCKLLFQSIGPTIQEYIQSLGKDGNYAMSTSEWEPYFKTFGNDQFVQLLKTAYGADTVFDWYYAMGYGGGQVLEQAVTKAGSLDGDAVLKVLKTEKFKTVLAGERYVDDTGIQVGGIRALVQWINLNREVVWPPDIATHDPIVPMPPWSQR